MNKTKAVISNNVVNLYSKPDSDSEQVSQAIMGQPVWIEREDGEWVYVRTWDNYRGWARSRWVIPLQDSVEMPTVSVTSLFAGIFISPEPDSGMLTKVVITTELEAAERDDGWISVTLPDGRRGYLSSSDILTVNDDLIATAKRFIGTPYLWGGTTPFGIDCSGFTQLVYRIHGTSLPRDACMQAEDTRARPVDKSELSTGDLVFFAGGKDGGRITHVGIAIGDGRFIHASGSGAGVIISSLDEARYQRTYWGARRYFPE